MSDRLLRMRLADLYPAYVAKVVRKGRTEAELRRVIDWLLGYDAPALDRMLATDVTVSEFFSDASLHARATAITGTICGVRVEEIADPLMRRIRYLDKLVDELAKGRPLERVLRS